MGALLGVVLMAALLSVAILPVYILERRLYMTGAVSLFGAGSSLTSLEVFWSEREKINRLSILCRLWVTNSVFALTCSGIISHHILSVSRGSVESILQSLVVGLYATYLFIGLRVDSQYPIIRVCHMSSTLVLLLTNFAAIALVFR